MNTNTFEWTSFVTEIEELSEKGKSFLEFSSKDSDEFQIFTDNYKVWRNEVITFLTDRFDSNNYYVLQFKMGNSNRYNFGGPPKPIEQKIKEKKEDITSDLRYLKFILQMVSISDIYTKPQEINLSIRQNYTSEEILELLLSKLYDLYGDGIYPVKQILEGNGITLKKTREEFEYVSILESNDFIASNNISREADAQLTLNGKRYVEEKRKIASPNYNSIADDYIELSSKIDDLKIELEKLGYGQNIIFEELEELKEYFTVLNKKSWAQLLKGKLFDLGSKQIISWDVMKMIYESVVHDTLRLQ
ncbi:hypothetical protein [Flavobacterium sp. UBA7682]|uniref:hypothetical protein n=1 Tax=Flavobacterium sp. UBA7682 TaxID=1946560 RepID=UPI0025BE7439|nr:hypothetical protein [Flavobacterium sp. UBA7682]